MYKQLDYSQVTQLLSDKEVVVADVRDVDSYNDGHLPNAVHLSMATLQDFCLQSDKSSPILVYCNHGISSQPVAQHLIDQGFEEVYSLIGGYELWKTQHSAAS